MKILNQLSRIFAPENYEIILDIDREKREFRGKVKISGIKLTDENICLHAKNLEISRAKINGNSAEILPRENDEIELKLKNILQNRAENSAENFENSKISAKLLIELEFSGKIVENSMHGLYPCRYEISGKKKELLATQFESHHAREVFPCIDEPAAKATFDLTLITEKNVEVLSNSEKLWQKNLRAKLATKFDKTPKMSTYLLAFVIGDLQKISAKTARGIEVNIFATKAQKTENLKYAAEVATRAIDFFENYFGVNYPLTKSDHVALPDFSSGAMENWGLITYRESCLLLDENSSLLQKSYIATVISHELSHQWFGNLVTMKWWNDLWLNESFASLMENICTDNLFPEYKIWENFETTDVVAALRRDALAGVQSVRQNVESPDEISTLFDNAIVYAKGSRLLKMLRAFLGEENFRRGLTKYFEKFAYKNAEAEDLWNAFSEILREKSLEKTGNSSENLENFAKKSLTCHSERSEESQNLREKIGETSRKKSDENSENSADFSVADLMNPWLLQSGYPIVRAEFLADGKIKLSQKQFLLDENSENRAENSENYFANSVKNLEKSKNNSAKKSENNSEKITKNLEILRKNSKLWPIPLFSNDKNCPKIFDSRGIVFTPENLANFRLNVGNNSHFLFKFDENLRAKIRQNFAENSNIDKIALLNSLSLLARAGEISSVAEIDILRNLNCENSANVWEMMQILLTDLRKITENSGGDSRENLKKFVQKISRKTYEKFDFSKDFSAQNNSENLKKFENFAKKIEKNNKNSQNNFNKNDEISRENSQNENQNPAQNFENEKLRAIVFSEMNFAENENALEISRKIFGEYRENLAQINGNLRATIFSSVAKFGDQKDFDFLLENYKKCQDADLQTDFAIGLSSAKTAEKIDILVNLLNKTEIIRPQDLFYWFSWLLKNRFSREKTWLWLRENWDFIEKTFGGDKSFDIFPRVAGQVFSTSRELAEFREFFAPLRQDSALKRAIDVGEKDILARANWISRDEEKVAEKLAEIVKGNYKKE